MDVIQAILKEYEKNKIDANQLQDKLATALKPDITSEADLNQQVDNLQTQFKLPQQTWDGVKTLVVDSLVHSQTPNSSLINSSAHNTDTDYEDSDKTRIFQPPSSDFSAASAKTIVNKEGYENGGNDSNNSDKTVVRSPVPGVVPSVAPSAAVAAALNTNSHNSATIVNPNINGNAQNSSAETIVADYSLEQETRQGAEQGQGLNSRPTSSQGDSVNASVSGLQTGTQNGTQQELTNNYFEKNRFQTNAVELKPGSILKNRFILENELGHGGMSIVYRALDLRKQEANNRNPYIAIKILGAAFKNHPQSIRVLEHESQKIQSLAHPNIITVYDFDRDGDAIYMTMECLEGESLDVLIHKNRAGIAVEKALPIIESMGRGLLYAHSKNIIHSDLKPENVFITNENIVKVLDFGIARAKKMPDQASAQKDAAGNAYTDFDGANLGALTPPYASPEMFENADPDPRDDIYALGCVTYKLLTGRHPFDGKQSNQARDEGLTPQKINELSRKQWHTLAKSLAFDREERISTIAEFLDGIIPKKRTIWFYAGIAGTSIAILISAYSWYSASQKPVLPQITLSVEQKQKISDYFETADLYYSMGYFASPPGDSAFDQYQKILEIDPTNQAAIEGKKKIANQYKMLALKKLNTGNIDESLLLVKTGLIVEPENEDLLELQLKIHNQQTQ